MAGSPGQNHPVDGGGGGGGGGPNGVGGNHGIDDYNGVTGVSGNNSISLGSSSVVGGSADQGYVSISYTDEYGVMFSGGTITVSDGRVTHVFFNPGIYDFVGIY